MLSVSVKTRGLCEKLGQGLCEGLWEGLGQGQGLGKGLGEHVLGAGVSFSVRDLHGLGVGVGVGIKC